MVEAGFEEFGEGCEGEDEEAAEGSGAGGWGVGEEDEGAEGEGYEVGGVVESTKGTKEGFEFEGCEGEKSDKNEPEGDPFSGRATHLVSMADLYLSCYECVKSLRT